MQLHRKMPAGGVAHDDIELRHGAPLHRLRQKAARFRAVFG